MTNSQPVSHYSSNSIGVPASQPSSLAWLAIGALILLSVACYFAGAGVALRQIFPLASLAVGILLYARYPALYIGFTWWLWFLIALIRRLIDYRYGWDTQGFILITPFLVSLVTIYTFIKNMPKSFRMGGLPFVLAFFSIFYGFLVGLVNFQPVVVFRTVLDWMTPVLFGFHVFYNWRNYPEYRKVTQTAFVWCVLLTGIYGMVQYLIAPEWDRFWLINTKLTTNGTPEPMGIRVWSTMHSPGPFANVMMAGLLLLFTTKHPISFPASAVGYLSFLLTVVRSAWGGWLVGVLSLLTNLKPKLQMRLVVTMLVMMICVIPLVAIEPFSEVIADRLETVTNLQEDQSFNERSASYDRNLSVALSSPLGNGIGGTWIVDKDGKLLLIVLDSGILDSFFALGWFGALPYLGSIIMLMSKILQGHERRSDSFASAAFSISLGIFFQMVFGSAMLSLSGVIMWGFFGMSMAAKKYYHYQLNNGISQNY
jgi:hypothetical protein